MWGTCKMVIFSWPLFGTLTYDWSKFFNPFTPEPPVTAHADPCPFYRLWLQEKKEKTRREKRERGEERKWKVTIKTTVSFLNPKTISKFCFLRMLELCKLIFCIWIGRPGSVRPVNSFVVSFSSLQHDSDQKTTRLDSKRKISKGEWVKQLNSLAD